MTTTTKTPTFAEKLKAEMLQKQAGNLKEIDRASRGPRRMRFVDEAKPGTDATIASATIEGEVVSIARIERGAPRMGTPASMLVDDLHESATNPRKTFVHIEELAKSIMAQGLLSPLIVRKSPSKPGKWEVICGARRFRAAVLAGLAEVPVSTPTIVDDSAVYELQATENLQREQLTAIEEAESFEMLITKLGYTPEQVAARVGTSPSTVRGRVKLLELGPEARTAIAAGHITSSVGTALARSCPTHKLQADFLKRHEVGKKADSARALIQELQHEYTQSLSKAPFSLKDAGLHGGACTVCPKNARNGAPGLFDDVEKARDICTDVHCYRLKTKEALETKAEEVKAEGVEVLRGGAAAEALASQDLVKLGDLNHATHGRKTSWGEHVDRLPEDHKPEIVAVLDEKSGGVVKLVSRKAVTKAVAATSKASWAREQLEEAEQRRTVKAKARELAQEGAIAGAVVRDVAREIAKSNAVHFGAAASSIDPLLRLSLDLILGEIYLEDEELEALGFSTFEELEKKIPKLNTEGLQAMLFTISIFRSDIGEGYANRGEKSPFVAFAKRMGVDVEHYRKARESAQTYEAQKKAADDLMGKKKGGKS